MNAALRKVAIAALVMFAALLVNANVVQVGEASSLKNNQHNVRVLYSEYSHRRGPIVVDGKAIAESVPTNDSLKYLRTYPGGPMYAPITGFYSLVVGATGIEHAENPVLSGDADQLFVRRLSDYFTGRTPQGGAVVLTLNAAAQQAAWNGLHGRRGAVVALDPHTGAILALVSSPSYDPTVLSTHNPKQIQRDYQQLLSSQDQPLLDRALNATYPPGSLFKVVTAAAALSTGRYHPDTRVPAPTRLKLPLSTKYLQNFGGETCGDGRTDTISDAFRISCNTAFAGLGLSIGRDQLAQQAHAFGIGEGLEVPLGVTASNFPDGADRPGTALAAIGQGDVAITPLQGAMIAAAIANGGELMRPYLVQQERSPDESVIYQAQPESLGRAVSPDVARQMTALMRLVVDSGTGTAAQISGIPVAGKTGTAQHGNADQHLAPHAWFASFAPADDPRVAVAVIVEDGGGLGSDATGGQVAAPIARSVICAVLRCS